MKPLTKRFSEIIGIVNVGRGDEDRDVWHEVAALEARIEAVEKAKGLVIPKCEWSICARHNRAYWTKEGCLSCRIEALDRERDAWKDAALKQAKALGAARILDDRDWANMPVFVKAAQALDTALRSEEER